MRSSLLLAVLLAACTGSDPTEPSARLPDNDGDGFPQDEDCNDREGLINPGAIERCDGIDNDCDGLIDDQDDNIDPVSMSTWYGDQDGDGFGRPGRTEEACEASPSFVDNPDDCDDTSAAIFPGAPERCDAIDNDCNPETPDAGVAFLSESGEWTSRTSEFSSGTESSPSQVTLGQDGTLYVCEGTWYTSIRVEADVSIVGRSGALETVLDGGGQVPGIWIRDPVFADVEGLTLRNHSDSSSAQSRGASLHCESDAVVDATDLVVEGGPPQVFGGLVSVMDGCTLNLSNADLAFGEAQLGGLMYVGGGTAVLDGVGFLQGLAKEAGGGVAVGMRHRKPSDAFPSLLQCTACTFDGNASDGGVAPGGGGAAWVGPYGTMETEFGIFVDNRTVDVGGAVLLDSGDLNNALFTAEGTEFRFNEEPEKVENDVAVPAVGGSYVVGPVANTTCNEVSGCL